MVYINDFNFVDWALLSGFALSVLVLLYYYFGVFAKLAAYKQQPGFSGYQNPEPVSIIIAARNELENLQKNLMAILEQDYPEFEVIVVNDCSWDGTQAWLEELQLTQPRLRVSQLIEQEKYPTGKKFALTIGIKAAKYNQLLFTDADCEPTSNQWLRLMQSGFSTGREIVLGYSPYRKRKGLLNQFIRFETLMTAQFYLSAALMRNAFMGVGRNLAYRKELFFKHKGFAGHQHIMSGDDDLFVNEAATPNNVAIQINPASFIYTEPKTTFSGWSRQKSRHISTGKYYKGKHKRLLGTYYLFSMLFYGFIAAVLLVNFGLWPYLCGIFGIKLISQSIVFWLNGKKLKCQHLVFNLLLLDLLYVLYLIVYGTKGLFTKNRKQW
ncbi:MAG: glycosyltransferase [Bacteroidota bacterium]|jgi:biofilm PGA synthesis N-glycosyltransferase PgaC